MQTALAITLLYRIEKCGGRNGALVAFRDLRQLLCPNLGKTDFDQLILSAAKAGLISLHATDYPAHLTDSEIADYVFRPDTTAGGCGRHPKGRYFVGCTIRLDSSR